MRWAAAIFLAVLLTGIPVRWAGAEEPAPPEEFSLEDLARRQWESLGVDDMWNLVGDIYEETGRQLPPMNWDTVRGILRGEGLPVDGRDVLGILARSLFGAVMSHAGLLGRLVLLAVLLAILHLLQTAFEGRTVATVAYAVVYLALVVIALSAFHEALQTARDTVRNLVGFMQAVLPLMVTLLAGTGAFISAGLLSPLVVMMASGAGTVAANWVLPLLFLGTVLDVADHLPGRMRVSRLAAFMRQTGMIVLGFTLTVFLGVMAVQGIAGGVADSVLLRTAKYTAGTFIPVLGGMFADAAELVFGSSLVLKNSIGLMGAVVVLFTAAIPLTKVLALVLVFRLAAALVQPVVQGPFVDALAVMGDGLLHIGLATAAVVLMFFLMLTVVAGVGSATVMLR